MYLRKNISRAFLGKFYTSHPAGTCTAVPQATRGKEEKERETYHCLIFHILALCYTGPTITTADLLHLWMQMPSC